MAGIDKLKITNFKSYKDYDLVINNNNKHIVIYGKNGVGKTNILESLSLFSNAKGLRGTGIEETMPKDNTSKLQTKISINIISLIQKYKLSLLIKEESGQFKKNYMLDNKKISLRSIKNYISFIWLTPYMDKIMNEGQTLKRNFIDKMIAQNDRFFNKIILQNKKDMAERLQVLQNSNDEKWLSLLEKKIASNIFEIFVIRRKYAEELNNIILSKLANFSCINIEYKNNLFNNLSDKCISVSLFMEELKKKRQLDTITKRSNFGINTDEIIFFDKKNNINTNFCSTGEQKSSLLTLILANCWKLKLNNKDFILLLDEATSHIDDKNFKNLFLEVDKFDTQIWYTGTNKKMFQVIENKGFFIHLQ